MKMRIAIVKSVLFVGQSILFMFVLASCQRALHDEVAGEFEADVPSGHRSGGSSQCRVILEQVARGEREISHEDLEYLSTSCPMEETLEIMEYMSGYQRVDTQVFHAWEWRLRSELFGSEVDPRYMLIWLRISDASPNFFEKMEWGQRYKEAFYSLINAAEEPISQHMISASIAFTYDPERFGEIADKIKMEDEWRTRLVNGALAARWIEERDYWLNRLEDLSEVME